MSLSKPGTDDDDGRYASLELDSGESVIYDRENHQAWIQADYVPELSKLR